MSIPLSSLIKDYFFPLMEIKLESSVTNNFLKAIEEKNKENVQLWYPEIYKACTTTGHGKLHFNRMRFYINSEMGTDFPFVHDNEFNETI